MEFRATLQLWIFKVVLNPITWLRKFLHYDWREEQRNLSPIKAHETFSVTNWNFSGSWPREAEISDRKAVRTTEPIRRCALCWLSIISYPTRACGIIIKYHCELRDFTLCQIFSGRQLDRVPMPQPMLWTWVWVTCFLLQISTFFCD